MTNKHWVSLLNLVEFDCHSALEIYSGLIKWPSCRRMGGENLLEFGAGIAAN